MKPCSDAALQQRADGQEGAEEQSDRYVEAVYVWEHK